MDKNEFDERDGRSFVDIFGRRIVDYVAFVVHPGSRVPEFVIPTPNIVLDWLTMYMMDEMYDVIVLGKPIKADAYFDLSDKESLAYFSSSSRVWVAQEVAHIVKVSLIRLDRYNEDPSSAPIEKLEGYVKFLCGRHMDVVCGLRAAHKAYEALKTARGAGRRDIRCSNKIGGNWTRR